MKISSHSITALFQDVFLPTRYPHSVTEDYKTYQIWDSWQAFFSTISGMLSTQAMLKSMGVGNAEASSLSATLTWVLQDGMGMVARILFTYHYATDMDRNVKFYRFMADVFNNAGMACSLVSTWSNTPSLFLCLAGVFWSVCGVCGGATRFSLTQHFAKCDNVGDVSAKDGSQETIVNLFGKLVGSVMLRVLMPEDLEDVAAFVFVGFIVLAVLHLYCNYRAVRGVVLDTLNGQRLHILLKEYQSQIPQQISSPKQVSQKEHILAWNLRYFRQNWIYQSSGENESDLIKALEAYQLNGQLDNLKPSQFQSFISKIKAQGWKVKSDSHLKDD